jgi:hypothetical protein
MEKILLLHCGNIRFINGHSVRKTAAYRDPQKKSNALAEEEYALMYLRKQAIKIPVRDLPLAQ